MHWVPLESNPTVFTQYTHTLGSNTSVGYCDVYGLDDDLLAMVPKPVYAICLLVPSPAAKSMARETESKTITDFKKIPSGLWYTHQTVSNACGGVAMMHILANVKPSILKDDSSLGKFVKDTIGSDPVEIAKAMESSDELAAAHDNFAKQGQTAPPNAEDRVEEHFIALVPFEGKLIELDGAKKGPVVHCETTAENFLTDAAAICQKYMTLAEGSLKFAVTALVDSDKIMD